MQPSADDSVMSTSEGSDDKGHAAPRNRIARRLLISTLAFSAVVTLIATSIQLYIDFRRDTEAIEQAFMQIEAGSVPSLTSSVWSYDEEQIELQLIGLLQHRDIVFASVTNDRDLSWQAGKLPADNYVLTRKFSLVYEERNTRQILGTLTVVADLSFVYSRLTDTALVVLGTNAVIVFLVGGFVFLLFERLVTRHLTKLADHLDKLELDKPASVDAVLNREPHEKEDELDRVAGAVNEMHERLRQGFLALQESEQRLSATIQAASDHIWELDEHLCFRSSDDMIAEVSRKNMNISGDITKMTPRDVSERLGELEPEFEGRDSVLKMLDAIESRRGFRDFVFQSRTWDGSLAFSRVSAVPIYHEDGSFAGLRGATTNVTEEVIAQRELAAHRDQLEQLVVQRTVKLEEEIGERKKAEEALRTMNTTLEKRVQERTASYLDAKERAELANKSKTDFLNNMSHELRTPLNAIIGFSEIIGAEMFGKLNNDKYHEYIRDINSAGKYLLDLLSDILDISKVEAGTLDLDEDVLDLGVVLAGCKTIVAERARDKKINLDIDEPKGVKVRADNRRLKQVVINLLSNAIKFTPEEGQVRVSMDRSAHGDVRIFVSDSGIGIAKEDIPVILQPFAQVESSLVRSHEGVGLGLPITKSLVEMHGGTLEVESELGRGTIVTITIPVERVVAPGEDGEVSVASGTAG